MVVSKLCGVDLRTSGLILGWLGAVGGFIATYLVGIIIAATVPTWCAVLQLLKICEFFNLNNQMLCHLFAAIDIKYRNYLNFQ